MSTHPRATPASREDPRPLRSPRQVSRVPTFHVLSVEWLPAVPELCPGTDTSRDLPDTDHQGTACPSVWVGLPSRTPWVCHTLGVGRFPPC